MYEKHKNVNKLYKDAIQKYLQLYIENHSIATSGLVKRPLIEKRFKSKI